MKSSIFGRGFVDASCLTELRKQLLVFIVLFKLSVITLINLLIKLDKKLKTDLSIGIKASH